MKFWIRLLGALAIGLSSPGLAAARDHGRGEPEAARGYERGRPDDGYGRPDYGYGRPAPAYGYGRPGYGGPPRPPSYPPAPPSYPTYPRYAPPVYRGPPGYAPSPGYGRWRRGQVLPQSYRGAPVYDYDRYHLRRPPPGYYWTRQGGDFVLVAIASGLIFEITPDGD